MYDYVVTADDVDTLLAVDCTPMDDNTRQVIHLSAVNCSAMRLFHVVNHSIVAKSKEFGNIHFETYLFANWRECKLLDVKLGSQGRKSIN